MGVVVAFNYQGFITAFPEFNYLSSAQVLNYFTLATSFCRNDGCGPVNDPNMQSTLLNMLTAHIAQMFAPTASGQNAPQTVGRIANASEGSVSVQLQFDAPPTASWYIQTKYGAMYWQATAQFRTMHYRSPPNRVIDPFFIGGYVVRRWGM